MCAEQDVHLVAHPHPALRRYVRRYTGYRMTTPVGGVHRGLPSPTATLIVTIDEPIHLVDGPTPDRPGSTYDALVGGLHDRPAFVEYGRRQGGVQIDLTPAGVRAIFGMPISALWAIDVHLDQLVGPAAGRLQERLHDVDGWSERFAECDATLLRWVGAGRRHAIDPAVDRAWRSTVSAGGALRVGDLASRLGYSRQHLTRRFAAEVGVPPKGLAQLVRFDRARRRAASSEYAGRLAEVAAETGYADQAHLTREFRRFAGCSPLELFQDPLRSVPIVQADTA